VRSATIDQSDLIRRLIAGDPSALEEAYRRYAARCNAIAYRVLQNDGAAQDAVQEAFFSLWRHREGLVVRTAGIRAWLFVVARNAALTMLRSCRARAEREDRAPQPEDAQNPAELVDRRADADRVRKAVAGLPDDERSIVEMAYFRFMTMAQIAQATQTPLSTTKRRAQTALRRLGKTLEGSP
jgi:RNA polymerase sigma-70 factor (ECF subfamily)